MTENFGPCMYGQPVEKWPVKRIVIVIVVVATAIATAAAVVGTAFWAAALTAVVTGIVSGAAGVVVRRILSAPRWA